MNTQTLNKAKTLTGLTMQQVLAKLQEELPKQAYSAIPGGGDLTSINPHYTLEVLTQIFGPFGCGFGLDWQPENLFTTKEERQKKSGSGTYIRWVAGLDHATFWFELDDGENTFTVSYPISSGSENEDRSYAIRGARTNALQDGATKLLYQLDLFKKQKKTNPQSQPTGAPIKDPGSVIVPFDKAKELFGGTAPTIDALYNEDPDFVEWICNKIDGDVGNAARQYMTQFAGEISQLSGDGNQPINNMASLMAYAKEKGHTFAHAGKLLEHLGWDVAPRPDEADKWNQAVLALDDAKEGDAASGPFQPEATS